jgi:hypothetical protein
MELCTAQNTELEGIGYTGKLNEQELVKQRHGNRIWE